MYDLLKFAMVRSQPPCENSVDETLRFWKFKETSVDEPIDSGKKPLSR